MSVTEGTVNNKSKSELESMQLELKKLELEAKRLELQDIQERVDDRKLQRYLKEQRARTNGDTLRSIAENDKVAQERCNHHKGGNGAEAIIGGQGDDSQYAVMKHQFANGDIWVRCLRCGKTWKPPLKEDFYFDKKGRQVAKQDGEFSEEAFHKAEAEYKQAVQFQTRNVMSGSHQLRFTYTETGQDASDVYRKSMRHTTLR